MNDSDWPLTTERIERALAEVRATPCPRSAYCSDDASRVQFSLHIIAEKALAELLEHRAVTRCARLATLPPSSATA